MNIFQQLFQMAGSCMTVRFTQLWAWRFMSTDVSQGSVATRIRCGGIFRLVESHFFPNTL